MTITYGQYKELVEKAKQNGIVDRSYGGHASFSGSCEFEMFGRSWRARGYSANECGGGINDNGRIKIVEVTAHGVTSAAEKLIAD